MAVSSTTVTFQCVLCFVTLVSVTYASNCHSPREIKDATYDYMGLKLPNGKYKSGAVVTYTCNAGFTKGKDSNGTYTCVKGSWEGDAENLRCCKVQMCIDPELFCILPSVSNTSPDIISGDSSFPIDKGAGMAYGLGTTVKFNCHDDFLLSTGSVTGPFECMQGGHWSPNNFTRCDAKECGPPPNIANGRAEKQFGLRGGNAIGEQYKYVCDDGYETFSIIDRVICTSRLTWETSLGFGPMPLGLDLPACSLKTPYNPYGTNYGSSGTNYGSGSSSGDTTWSSNSYGNNYKKRGEWNSTKTTVFVLFVGLILIIFAAVICARARSAYRNSSRTRAIVVNGVTTTEYVSPTNYSGPPPTLTTGPAIFAPPGGPPSTAYQPTQGGMYPPETYPLTSHSPRGSGHFDAPPPAYNDATTYRSNTTPSAPAY